MQSPMKIGLLILGAIALIALGIVIGLGMGQSQQEPLPTATPTVEPCVANPDVPLCVLNALADDVDAAIARVDRVATDICPSSLGEIALFWHDTAFQAYESWVYAIEFAPPTEDSLLEQIASGQEALATIEEALNSLERACLR